MGYFYFDESIQQRHGFILGAFVYSPTDLDLPLHSALLGLGLSVGRDEMRSRTLNVDPALREQYRSIIREHLAPCRIGALVHPAAERATLGEEALQCLKKLVEANGLSGAHIAVFDEGVFRSQAHGERALKAAGLERFTVGHFQSDSRLRAGLQVADSVAHRCGRILVERMAESPKMVRAGEDSGYDPDELLPLEFELWASMRFLWFRGPGPTPPDDVPSDWEANVADYGFHVSAACNPELASSALECFGKVYLGCIH